MRCRRSYCGMLLFICVLVLPVSARAAEPKRLAIMPLSALRIDQNVTKILTDILTVEAGNLGQYKVIGANEVQALLSAEQLKDAIGCDDVSCASDIAGALHSDLMITGSVGLLGSQLNINLTLHDAKKFEVRNRIRETVANNENLYEKAILRALRRLFKLKVGSAGTPTYKEGVIGSDKEWNPNVASLVIVTFDSQPSGAVVMVDGEMICQNSGRSCRKTLSAGNHTVSMQKENYQKRTETVYLRQGMHLRWELSANFGLLSVDSQPSGRRVTVNRKAVGTTPLSNYRLSPGGYEVLVDDRCYQRKGKRILMQRNDKKTLNFTLKPRQGALRIMASNPQGQDEPAQVYVDGSYVGNAPGVLKVPVCAKMLEVRHRNYESYRTSLHIAEHKVHDIKAQLTDKRVVQKKKAPKKRRRNSYRSSRTRRKLKSIGIAAGTIAALGLSLLIVKLAQGSDDSSSAQPTAQGHIPPGSPAIVRW